LPWVSVVWEEPTTTPPWSVRSPMTMKGRDMGCSLRGC
jgi:hypothetical protein